MVLKQNRILSLFPRKNSHLFLRILQANNMAVLPQSATESNFVLLKSP